MKTVKKSIKKIVMAVLVVCATSTVFAQTNKPDGLKAYNEGRYKEAISICESELAENPNNLDAYTVLSWALIATKQYSEAEQRATAGRRVNAYDVRLIEVLGEAKYYLGKNDEAMNLFERYVANVQSNASRLGKVYYFMGEIYIKKTKYEHADISLSMAVRMEPLRDDWWTRLGYAREQIGDYANAISAYDKALSLNSTLTDASSGKIRCQQHL